MKMITYIIIITIILLFIGHTEISFSPFSIKIQNISSILGVIFLALALACFRYGDYQNGYKKGLEENKSQIQQP